MNNRIFESLLACPKCKTKLYIKNNQGKCILCKKIYKKIDGIWHLLKRPSAISGKSKKQYNEIFNGIYQGPQDGSYEVLATIAKGNLSVDIACGIGNIEKFAPSTIAVDFSLTALNLAKSNGAKYLVLADAHNLPFLNCAFTTAICAGSLEHFTKPQQVLLEIARISKIQVLTVHSYPQVLFGSLFYKLISKILFIRHQPIEKPLSKKTLFKMIKSASLHQVFSGVWTLPLNYGRVIGFLPEFKQIPSSWFIITVNKKYL